MKEILLLFVTGLLLGCSEKVSDQLVDTNTNLGAQIMLTTSFEENKVNSVSIRLFDNNDKVIASNLAEVYINTTLLNLVGGTRQRYYHVPTRLRYFSDSIPKSEHYVIYLKTYDGIKRNLAYFSPLNKEDIVYGADNTSEDVLFKWQSKKEIESMQLNFTKSTYYRSERQNKDSVITKKVDPVMGEFLLNKSFLKPDSNNMITHYFSANANIKTNGMLSSKLLPGSSVVGETTFSFNTNEIEKKYVMEAY